MREPKPVPVTNQNGVEKIFILHKFDAVAGREIVSKYPVANVPQLGDYNVSKEIMFKLMGHVAVQLDSGLLFLTTEALIDNHCEDWEVLAKLEIMELDYNISFFGKGKTSAFLENLKVKALPWISSILTALSEQSLAAAKPPSTN